MRQNFSNNWFGVIKNYRILNPLSLYSYEEILEMIETKKENEKLYGYHPIKYIGNLVGFRNLKGDYLHSKDFSNTMSLDYPRYNYGISQITFTLRVIVEANKLRFNIELHIASDLGGRASPDVTMDLLRNDVVTKKMFSDFVEIYNMPNHRYKNMYASLSTGERKKLKDLISRDKNPFGLTQVELSYAKGPAVLNILRELKL